MLSLARAPAVSRPASIGCIKAQLTEPTFPESAGGTDAQQAANTKIMLEQWSGGPGRLHPLITRKDVPETPLVPYGERSSMGTRSIYHPLIFRPASRGGCTDDDGWARRVDAELLEKWRNITLTVPDGVIR
jgi:hypothetical protein